MKNKNPVKNFLLFPYTLIRVSGGSFDEFEKTHFNETIRITEELYQKRKFMNVRKQELCDDLYLHIQDVSDNIVRNELIVLKRDIFNSRKLSLERVKGFKSMVQDELYKKIETYLEEFEYVVKKTEDIEKSYNQELRNKRKELRLLAMDENLQKGLLLSSHSLLNSINEFYLRKDNSVLKKKDLNSEQGLIKYVSRVYGKTSPFSTFTNLATAVLSDIDEEKLWKAEFIGEKPEVKCHVRLNNYLYKYITTLLTKNSKICREFLIRLNPSIRRQENEFVFLTNNNNVEAFQRVAYSPVIGLFHQVFLEKNEGIIYRQLISEVSQYIEATEEEIGAYVNQLLNYGFLEYSFGVSGIDPNWDVKFCEVLSPIANKNELIKELVETLQALRRVAEKYSVSDVSARKILIEEAFTLFRETCMKLHADAGLPEEERKTKKELEKIALEKQKELWTKQKVFVNEQQKEIKNDSLKKGEIEAEQFEEQQTDSEFTHQMSTFFQFRSEQIFYEDSTLGIQSSLSKIKVSHLVQRLNELLQSMRFMDGRIDEMDKMVHFFTKKYKKESAINVLTFYEDFYRNFKKPEAEWAEEQRKKQSEQKVQKQNGVDAEGEKKKEEKQMPEMLNVTSIKMRQEKNKVWMEKFTESILPKMLKTDTIDFPITWLDEMPDTPETKVSVDEKSSSFGSFIQLFVEKDESGQEQLRGVVNSVFPGFGKMFSRFLHILDDDITDKLRAYNLRLHPSALLAEDCDASFFNANLHPPLMPFEVWMPGGQNMLSPEQQIPVTELSVQINQAEDNLQLIHQPTQKPVFVFDLGFQGGKGRSQLFLLLEKFSLTEYLPYFPLVNALQNALTHAKTTSKLRSAEGISEQTKENPAQEDSTQKQPQLFISPRVTLDGILILQRKAWHIPKALLPTRNKDEKDWEYFIRVNEWRLALSIPEEVMVFVNPRTQQASMQGANYKKVRRDDYKPQYISFANPFLVNLLEKLFEKVPHTFKIEEMIPNSKQLLKIGEKRYVTEFVIQWYLY